MLPPEESVRKDEYVIPDCSLFTISSFAPGTRV